MAFGGVGNSAIKVARQCHHELSTLLEQIAAPIGRINLVADGARIGLLHRPIVSRLMRLHGSCVSALEEMLTANAGRDAAIVCRHRDAARNVVSHHFLRNGVITDLCALQLQDGSKLTARALAVRVMGARDLDATNTTLRNSFVLKVFEALRHAAACDQMGDDAFADRLGESEAHSTSVSTISVQPHSSSLTRGASTIWTTSAAMRPWLQASHQP